MYHTVTRHYTGRAGEIIAKKNRWYEEERVDFTLSTDLFFGKETFVGPGANAGLYCRDGEVIVHVFANRKFKLDFSTKVVKVTFGGQVFTNTMKNGEQAIFEGRCDPETVLRTLLITVNDGKPIQPMVALAMPNSPYTKERLKALVASAPVKYDVYKGLYKSEGCCVIL